MPQAINLDALEVVDAIDRRGSFARAAEELDRATSALSYTVQKLEEQLGVTLFQRQGRNSVLTPAGRLLLDEGRHLLAASNVLADRVKELADGWEPRIRIGLESTADCEWFFGQVARFLDKHQGIELDVIECVLNGGWEALEHDRIELLVGAPGPVPQHKGLRSQAIAKSEMVLVAASHHPICKFSDDGKKLTELIPQTRRVVTHDTATINVVRNVGLIGHDDSIYVQTLAQKIQAQLAGIGIGHLPRTAIKSHLEEGTLVELLADDAQSKISPEQNFLAWKLSNKGKGLKALVTLLQQEN